MRNNIYNLLSLFMLLLSVVCSCKDDNNEPTPPEPSSEITIPSSENLNPVLSQEGGTVSISFTTTADWTAFLVNTRAESWITVTPNSGSKGKNEITITATTNETYDERNATVVLKCGSDSKNIVVTQKQKDALTVTSSKYEVASKGGNISVEVKANINFEVEVKADWIKQVKSSNTRALTTSNLNFTIEPNETGDKREGEIIIKSGELSETVKVYQGFENFITLTQKDFTIPEEGGNVDIEIKSTLNYEVKMLSDVDWITEVQSRAVSTHTHHYTVSPNDTYDSREAKIVFYDPKDENVADTVSIYQMYKGAILVARNEYQFGIDGGTLNLAVQTNLEFDIEISDSWIQQVQPTRALTEYNLSFAISKNTEQKDREGTITVKDKNSDKKQVVTIKQSYVDPEREALIALYKATNGDNWTNNTNWCSDKPVSEWYGITIQDGEFWIDLPNNNLAGELPKEIGSLKRLTHLLLSGNNITGTIPEEIGNLDRLTILELSSNSIEGNIPKEIGNLKEVKNISLSSNKLEGNIPECITNLTQLEIFGVYSNQLIGNIPEDIGSLIELKGLYIGVNKLSGTIPKSIGKLKKLTSFEAEFNNLEGSVPEELADLPLLTDLSLQMNRLSGSLPARLVQCDNWKVWQPDFTIIPQQEGSLTVEVESLYTSTDYSKDGEVFTLQEHSKGNGIKLVIMGDLFVDTDMNPEGVYETRMKEAMEHYFSIEPFGSLREYFDVVAIKAVSKHSQLNQECAFSTNTRSGNIFYGDMDKCMRYAQKAIGDDNLDNVSVIMALNVYAGMSQAFLYNNGFSIAYCPLDRNLQVSAYMVHHEANGHGFGYLLDEYIISGYSSSPTQEDIEHYTQRYEKYGYYANIDFTNDLQNIRWAHFINDSRYSNEKLGVYEGAAYWPKGAYRPTEFSIMCSGEGLFNAPGREAIYKRAMKLAYGDSWTYDYEEFVKFDEPGRAEWINWYGTNTRSVNKKTIKDYKHIPPKIFNYPAVVK